MVLTCKHEIKTVICHVGKFYKDLREIENNAYATFLGGGGGGGQIRCIMGDVRVA